MGRSRKNGPVERFVIRLGSIAACVVILAAVASEGEWVLFTQLLCGLLIAFSVWVLFVMKTTCDVEKSSNGQPCENTAYGWLRACHLPAHKQKKRRALAARIGFRVWAERTRQIWRDPSTPVPRTTGPSPSTGPSTNPSGVPESGDRVCRSSYELISFACTVTSTLSGLVATTVTVLTNV